MLKLCIVLICIAGLQAGDTSELQNTPTGRLKASFDALLAKYPASNLTELAEQYNRSGYATLAKTVRHHILTEKAVAEVKRQLEALPANSTKDNNEQFAEIQNTIERQEDIYEVVSKSEKLAEVLKKRALLIAAKNPEKHADVKDVVIKLAKAGNPENGTAIDGLYQKISFEVEPLNLPEYQIFARYLLLQAYSFPFRLNIDATTMKRLRKIVDADVELEKKMRANTPLASEEKVNKFWELLPELIKLDKNLRDVLETKEIECNLVRCWYTNEKTQFF